VRGDRRSLPSSAPRSGVSVIASPSTWLLRVGWHNRGRLSVYDGPVADRTDSAPPVPRAPWRGARGR
jgi:hypothetical protein